MGRNVPLNAVIETPIGRLGIELRDGALTRLLFLSGSHRLREPDSAAARRAVSALIAYFEDSRKPPQVTLQVSGTDFQQRVWRALRAIPVGHVMTYGALAERLGTSARAVGNACRANPVPIVVPCHRVVARNGTGGFAGDSNGRMVSVKRRLLCHEGVEIGTLRPHR